MIADEFLKSSVLVKIIHVKMYGKKILSGKIKGLIVGATVMACFLLMHNPEFTAIGAETKINYQADYDFYLECLFKCMPWACSVMDYFNKEVFSITNQSCVPASNNSPTASPS
ncbi:uncharacterized protein BJ212DRAFT_1581429 [Suillus subaureus]|uniref:Uncharacterized protein n=1 Tax=Suillus subaureus TaxID=48587 RepID=A0A9P7J463_9AGAM|nr:uncharacterized protein BJ212DRAFT_1581429 [Suillus subaureus]KAG1801782.1 hypothetical protein BJ212DRAFT_1581429 [Suillus subaureus]